MALLEIEGLTKKYDSLTAADRIGFQVNAGEIVALIGENGAGKTTILNCLAGSIAATEGRVTYKGQSLFMRDSLRSEFGFLIQVNFFEYMNAFDNLDILLRLTGRRNKAENKREIISLLRLVGLEEKSRKYVRTFSFGMKQRLGLAQALIGRPRFLVLDEPFVGLDPPGKRTLKDVIREKAKKENAGVLFSSHDLEDVVEICDRVVMIEKGKVIYDDVFRTAKRYVLCMKDRESADRLNRFYTKAGRKDNRIIFQDFKSFHAALRTAEEEGAGIEDVEIQEDSLYDFFEGGNRVENENSNV